jgi:hypothetical protein
VERRRCLGRVLLSGARRLEEHIGILRREQGRRTVAAERRLLDTEDIRARWFSGDLDISQKRAYVREALHSVIIHPAGPSGRGRAPFRADLFED